MYLKNIFIALLFLISNVSCEKDTNQLTGCLNITFNSTDYNVIQNLHPKLYSIENTNTPIFQDLLVDSNGTLKINDILYGNYLLRYYQYIGGSSLILKEIGFQIISNKTTEISIDI